MMKVEFHGTPNWQRFAETWAALIAAREGLEVVPGSVKVELKGETHGSSEAERNSGQASALDS